VCFRRIAVGVIVGLMAGVPLLGAQSSGAGASIVGAITDQLHAGIAGATVVATSAETAQQWRATTDAQGRFRLLALPLGSYRVSVDVAGFARAIREVTLAVGQTADVQFQLSLAEVSEELTVSVPPPLVDTLRTQTAEVVTPREVQTLPLNGRNYLDLALLTPGVSRTNVGASQRFAETSAVPGTGVSVSSQRNLNNSFIVDGLSANDDAAGLAGTFYSQEVIREFQVISSGAVAEFGRASSGIVNIVTQSGTNAVHGATYGFFRNDALDARNPLSKTKDPLSQQQFGLTLSGPIRRDHQFLFGNVEGTRNRRTGLITIDAAAVNTINGVMEPVRPSTSSGTGGGAPLQTGDFATGFDTFNAFGRYDREWSPSVHGSLRYTTYHVTSPNARTVGALNAVSRGTSLDNLDQTVAFSLTSALSTGLLHEARAQATRSRLDAPVNDSTGPAVNISGVASFGTSTASPTARALDLYEVVDTLSSQQGPHLIKAGADALWNRVDIEFPGALQGVYTFPSLATFAAGRYATYQQAFGAASQFQSNPNLAAFVEDEWRARQDVVLNAGVRYDVQWLPSPIHTDANNVSPRVGLAWSPGDRRTVIRANAGVFFDRIPLRATSNALQRDGSKYQVAVLPFGAPNAPVFPSRLTAFPDGLLISVTTIDPRIQSASSRQAAVSIDRALGAGTSIEVGYQHVTGRGIVMSRNINAPTLSASDAAGLGIANLGRPDPRLGNNTEYQSIGQSAYDGLTVSLRARSGLADGRVAYTLSRAMDDAGNFFFSQPQDAGDPHGDWGPSDNDQRHRLTLSGSLRSPEAVRAIARRWRISGVLSYGSALPFNPQTGNDRNNDTNVNDRPVGFTRNSVRGFDSATLDLRLSRTIVVGPARLELMADAFNVLNRANLALPNATYGAGTAPIATFGQATAAGDPRQVQVGARVSW
jgi:carboxypeptidase family protein